jgi:hypothetical protein
MRRTEDGARKLYQRLLDEAAAKKTLAARLYPHLLKPKPEEPTKPAPIQGWSHLSKAKQ